MQTETVYFNSSSGGTHGLAVLHDGTRVDVMRCDCPAGQFSQLCKHVKAMFAGDMSMLHRPDQHGMFQTIYATLQRSSFFAEYQRFQQALAASTSNEHTEQIKASFMARLQGEYQPTPVDSMVTMPAVPKSITAEPARSGGTVIAFVAAAAIVLVIGGLAFTLAVLESRRPSTQATTSTASAASQPSLTYSKPTFKTDSFSTRIMFDVRNTSSKPLEFVQVHAKFLDKNGTTVESREPYIAAYRSLAPGERSAVEILVMNNSRFDTFDLKFTANGERPFEKVDLIATQESSPEPPKKQGKKSK